MNSNYSYPPDKNLLREKLNCVHYSESTMAWQKFEQFWLQQTPTEIRVKKHFRFVGIPIPLILRGFISVCLILASLGIYTRVNSNLPVIVNSVKGSGKAPLQKSMERQQSLPAAKSKTHDNQVVPLSPGPSASGAEQKQ